MLLDRKNRGASKYKVMCNRLVVIILDSVWRSFERDVIVFGKLSFFWLQRTMLSFLHLLSSNNSCLSVALELSFKSWTCSLNGQVSSFAIREVEEYKNFCDRSKDQRPLPEEAIGVSSFIPLTC